MTRLTSPPRALTTVCTAIGIVGVFVTPLVASQFDARAERMRCGDERTFGHGAFDIPVTYRPVTDVFGMIEIKGAHGRTWHPAPFDIQRLGVSIHEIAEDDLHNRPLGVFSAKHVARGIAYSRAECKGLNCLYEAAYVPTQHAQITAECGVVALSLEVHGLSRRDLVAAQRAIHFRWGHGRSALSLAEFGPGS